MILESVAGGVGSAPVDPYTSVATVQVTTTDTSPTTLHTVDIDDLTLCVINCVVQGRKSDGTQRAAYAKTAVVYRQGGGATLQGSVQDGLTDVETTSGWDCTIDVNGNTARVRVTGEANVLWTGTVWVQHAS